MGGGLSFFREKSGPGNEETYSVRHCLPGTPDFPSSCPSLVYLADMYGIYKSNAPVLIKETSFKVKHCTIETVSISRSA